MFTKNMRHGGGEEIVTSWWKDVPAMILAGPIRSPALGQLFSFDKARS